MPPAPVAPPSPVAGGFSFVPAQAAAARAHENTRSACPKRGMSLRLSADKKKARDPARDPEPCVGLAPTKSDSYRKKYVKPNAPVGWPAEAEVRCRCRYRRRGRRARRGANTATFGVTNARTCAPGSNDGDASSTVPAPDVVSMAISAAEREVAGGAPVKVVPAARAEAPVGAAIAAGDLGGAREAEQALDVEQSPVVDELRRRPKAPRPVSVNVAPTPMPAPPPADRVGCSSGAAGGGSDGGGVVLSWACAEAPTPRTAIATNDMISSWFSSSDTSWFVDIHELIRLFGASTTPRLGETSNFWPGRMLANSPNPRGDARKLRTGERRALSRLRRGCGRTPARARRSRRAAGRRAGACRRRRPARSGRAGRTGWSPATRAAGPGRRPGAPFATSASPAIRLGQGRSGYSACTGASALSARSGSPSAR